MFRKLVNIVLTLLPFLFYSMDICSQNISVHFDYNEMLDTQVEPYRSDGYWYFCNNLVIVSAKKANGDGIQLDFNRETDDYYYGYDRGCTNDREMDGPVADTYPLYKSQVQNLNGTYAWVCPSVDAVLVYNEQQVRINGRNQTMKTGVYSAVKVNGTTYYIRYGSVQVSQNNVEGMFIESVGVRDYNNTRDIYFTIGNRSEQSHTFDNGKLTNNGSTFTMSGNDGSTNTNISINKTLTTGSSIFTKTNVNLANTSLIYEGNTIAISDVSGSIDYDGKNCTMRATIRDSRENVYCLTLVKNTNAIEYNDTICAGDVYDIDELIDRHADVDCPVAELALLTETPYTPNPNKRIDKSAVWSGTIYNNDDEEVECVVNVYTISVNNTTESKTFCYDEDDLTEITAFWNSHTLVDPSTGNAVALPTGITAKTQITAEEKKNTTIGTYTCTSTTTYNITIIPVNKTTDTQWICSTELAIDGFEWHGNVYYAKPAVAPTYSTTNADGCNDITVLDLNVCQAQTFIDTKTVCSLSTFSYVWDRKSSAVTNKTQADIKTFTYEGTTYNVVDSLFVAKTDCGEAYCEDAYYLAVQSLSDPLQFVQSAVICATEWDDLSGGYVHTFANSHTITVTDTLAGEKVGIDTYRYRDTEQNTDGCDIAHYTLDLRVVRPRTMQTDTIRQCSNDMEAKSWLIDGWAEHNDKEEFQWLEAAVSKADTMYYDTLRNAAGCDSIYYSLCYIQDTAYVETPASFFTPYSDYRKKDTVYVNLNTAYTWEGRPQATDKEGVFTDQVVLSSSHGCDSVRVLTLCVLQSEEHIYQTVCAGDMPYIWQHTDGADNTCYSAGIYEYNSKTWQNTDSTAILHLTVLTPVDSTYSKAIMAGDTYNDSHFAGLTAADTYTTSLKYDNTDCDSVVYRLTLTITQPEVKDTEYAVICSNEGGYEWKIDNWTEHNLKFDHVLEAGRYLDTLRSVTGRDSVYYSLQLTVYPAYTLQNGVTPEYDVDSRVRDTIYINKGDTYYFESLDQVLDEEGTYIGFDKTRITHCDSVTILTLYVLNNKEDVHATICSDALPYIWQHTDGEDGVYNASGDYEYLTLTTHGTDSIVTLHLTVNTAYNLTDGATICYSELADFRWGDVAFTDVITDNTGSTQTATKVKTFTTVCGCDSIVTYTLTVKPTFELTDQATICYNELADFRWEGESFTDLITDNTGVRQTAIKTKTLNTVNGCDSIVAFTLTVNPIKSGVDQVTICSSELPYRWNGYTIASAADAEGKNIILTTTDGCDSVVSLALTINNAYTDITDDATICYNELASFRWEGEAFDGLITANTGTIQTATLTKTLTTVATDCDSTVTFTLTVNPTFAVEDGATICYSELASFTWENETFTDLISSNTGKTQQVTKTKNLTTVNGCDSIVSFTLTVHPTFERSMTQTICDSELPYTIGQEVFTKGETRVLNLKSVNDCDSIVTITLVVLPTYTGITDGTSICYDELTSFRWEGETFSGLITANTGTTQTASLTKTLRTYNDCDSTVTFTLTVNPTYEVTDARTICESELPYRWEGNVFNTDATRTQTLTTVNGCDSIVHFSLTVQRTTIKTLSDEVCDNKLPYVWTTYHEQYLTEAGTYRDVEKSSMGCDSVIHILNLSVFSTPVIGNAVVANQNICPDKENLQIEFTYTYGRPNTYEVVFDANAIEQNFTDQEGVILANGTTYINVGIPYDVTSDYNTYPKADYYNATLRVTDQCEKVTEYPLSFTLLYPASLIKQKWNDVLAIYNEKYNGGMTFSNIRWYHNGNYVVGQGDNHSYIYETPHLSYGEPYWVELTRADDGKTFRTCEFYPEQKASAPERNGERVRIRQEEQNNSRTILIETDIEGTYMVYDITGKQLQKGRFNNLTDNHIRLDRYCTEGTYLIYFRGDEGETEVKKWLVK